MLISTGAARSFLHPQDAQRMGITPNKVPPPGRNNFQAILTLTDQDNREHHQQIEELIVVNPQNPLMQPFSMMGMDILQTMQLRYDHRENSLTIEPSI